MKFFQQGHIEMRIPSWLVFVVSFAVTLWLWHSTNHDNQVIRTVIFQKQVSLLRAQIRKTQADSEKVLLGCAGLFTASDRVSRDEWHRYVHHLEIERTLPGVQGLGFNQRVFAADLASHIRSIQAEGFASYTVSPQGERPEYFPVIFMEPFRDENLRSFGHDPFSEPTRRVAMERARDSGQTAISGRVTLVQDSPGPASHFGFILYHPVYSVDDSSLTLAARRQAFIGFVNCPVRYKDFLNSIGFGETGVVLYDGDEPDPGLLVFDSTTNTGSEKLPDSYVPAFEQIEKMSVFGRIWTLRFFSLPSFEVISDASKSRYILFLGFFISILFFGLSLIMKSRTRALYALEKLKADLEIRVQERTGDLRKSNRLLRMLSDWNQALIHADSETQLLETMVDHISRVGGYSYCLIGYSQSDAGQTIRLVAQKGFEDELLKKIDMSWAEASAASPCLGKAIRTRESVIINDLDNEPLAKIWHETIKTQGVFSLAAFPLISSGPVLGVIGILSTQKDAFDSSEIAILEEMAMDLAFGIETQRSRLARNLAEETLRLSEQNLKDAQALAHIGNFTLEIATGKRSWSDELYRIYGRDPSLPLPTLQEAPGLYTPESYRQSLAAIDKAIQDGKSYELVLEIVHSTGSNRWVRVMGQARKDSQGKVTHVFGTIQDITEFKLANEELQSHRKHLERLVAERTGQMKNILTNLVDGLFTISEDGTIQTVNPSGEKLFGYEATDLIGKNVRVLVPEPHGSGHDGYLKRYLETGIPHIIGTTRELFGLKKDGTVFPIELSVSEFKFEGKYTFIGMVRDISIRQRVEQELHAAKTAAENANRAKSVFLANMSHEIRTPMNAILGFAQVLERDHSLAPEHAEHIRTISRSGNHLLALINDILDVSKIEAGRVTFNPSAFSLKSFLDDLEVMFRSRAIGKGLEFLVERDDSVPTHVISDEIKLRQILVNLLGNAIKFTAAGRVILRLRAELAPGNPVTGYEPLRLFGEVEDSGPGISGEDLPKIFSTFHQGEQGMKAGGTGLGLVISRSFARLMGGDITVNSQPGKGSCFQFHVLLESSASLPLIEKPPAKRVIGLQPGTGPFRVLVADDVQENRSLLSALLCPLGFEVKGATNGVEALALFHNWFPHIVLMDMRMPVMDGYEAVRQMKASAAGREVPIIAVTASAFEDSKRDVMGTGADAYLRKPFQPEDLFAIMGKHLNLQFIFAEPPAAHISGVSTSHPSLAPELIAAMRKAIAYGDMVQMTELIAQVEKVNDTLAREIKKLADRFEYEKLAEFLSKEEKKNG